MARVGCAGLLVEDTFCGPLPALPPEGALTHLDDMTVRAGGCAANVAIDLVRQGVASDIVGCIGFDSAADGLLRAFKSQDVGVSGVVRVADCPTSRTVILLIEGQDRRYLHVTGANGAFKVEHISKQWLASLDVFYLGGLFGLPGLDFAQLAQVLEYCQSRNVATVVDVVAPEHSGALAQLQPLLPLIDVFLPNEDEARVLTGLTDPFDQLRLLEQAGAHTVIITRGSEGTLAVQQGRVWRSGTYQMDVVDPSGSGDAFTSGVIRALLLRWSLPQMLRYASAVGASATRAPGTTDTVFSAAEAERFIQEHPLTVKEEQRWT